MGRRKRRTFSKAFKSKVALEALKERKTSAELAREFELTPAQISAWKKQARQSLPEVFGSSADADRREQEELTMRLYEKIGRLEVELDWLKKSSASDLVSLRAMIDPAHPQLSISRQCELLGLARPSYYYEPSRESEENLRLMRLIDALYTARPFLGSRKMVAELWRHHQVRVNRKRVQRLMRRMGIASVLPSPATSVPHPEHTVYPYLLRDVPIERVDQVWSTDITYIPVLGGWVYLVAVMDWYSRFVLSWELSNTMETSFCIDALEQALRRSTPEVFNSDQGSQFTSPRFTKVLKDEDVTISMDGKGRCLDNVWIERLWRSVKYEEVYLNEYETVMHAWQGLASYIEYYNFERPHQSLDYQTPAEVYLGEDWQLNHPHKFSRPSV